MILGIDASNIRAGGGVTHLREIINNGDPQSVGFEKVIVWGGKKILNALNNKTWLDKCHLSVLDKGLINRAFWQRFKLSTYAKEKQCNLLFLPGGSYAGTFKPVVACHQNLLPFEWKELRRYGFSWMLPKMVTLRILQSKTFKSAEGVIYLTQYARKTVETVIGESKGDVCVIPHGVEQRFFHPPGIQKKEGDYSPEKPFRIVYISNIYGYKHQWHVAQGVALLKNRVSVPIILEIIGSYEKKPYVRLKKTLKKLDPQKQFLHYLGPIDHNSIHDKYPESDSVIFASSCEAFGQILLEAMASASPISCSNRSAMPEILADAGIYFDPEKPAEIAESLSKLITSSELRQSLSEKAYVRAKGYSWKRCAAETFSFLASVAKKQ